MSSRGRLEKGPKVGVDWEDEYRKLRVELLEQKKLTNEQDVTIKTLNTKFVKLEREMVTMERSKFGSSSSGRAGSAKISKDEENLVAKLTDQNHKLKSQNAELQTKNKALKENLERRKREIAAMKSRHESALLAAGAAPRGNKDRTSGGGGGGSPLVEIRQGPTSRNGLASLASPTAATTGNMADIAGHQKVLELSQKYKARAQAAEEQLRSLRMAGSTSAGALSRTGSTDAQVQEYQFKLQQLQTQYDYMVSKTSSQGVVNRDAEEQLDDMSRRCRELRRALEDLRQEKEMTDAKAARATDLEDSVRELRGQNRALEDRISRLCADPSIGDAFEQDNYRRRYEDTKGEMEDLRAQVARLQETLQNYYSTMVNLKEEAARLRVDKASAERKAEDLQLRQGGGGDGTLPSLFSEEDGISKEELERALTLVKRRGEAIRRPDFLEDPEGDMPQTVPSLQRKLNDVSSENLKLTKELEVKENMLKLQSAINKDLHKEVESMSSRKDKDHRDLREKLDTLEETALQRLEKIRVLEAQLRQHVYQIASKGGKAGAAAHTMQLLGDTGSMVDTSTVTSDADGNALLADLVQEGGGDLAPDQNMLEVWIKSATIRDTMLGPGTATFVVIDFFDYESQTTQLMSGAKPMWDFAATFKISVDDFLIRYLATDVVTLELNMTSNGDFSMIGRATVPLSSLLKSKPVIALPQHPVMSIRTGEVIAHVNMEMRLAIPISELYRLFLGRHPSERHHIENISNQRTVDSVKAGNKAIISAATADDETRLYNEFEVTVLTVAGLPRDGDRAPSPYVHFQFLGHPIKYTNPVMESCDATLNERFAFSMITNDHYLRLMGRSSLLLSVRDLKADESGGGEGKDGDSDDESAGLIGEVAIPLKIFAEGESRSDSYNIKNRRGDSVGVIEIGLRWKAPFRKQREVGPRALSGLEVENLISSFSPGGMGVEEGFVDYKAFARFISPPESVRRCIDVLREYSSVACEKEGLTHRQVFSYVLPTTEDINEDTFVEIFTALKLDVRAHELGLLYRFVDMDKVNRISLDQLLGVLNLDEIAGVPGSLQDKLRTRSRDLEDEGTSVLKLFQEADQWGANGMLSRMEFKGVLRSMGFNLIDDEENLLPASFLFFHSWGLWLGKMRGSHLLALLFCGLSCMALPDALAFFWMVLVPLFSIFGDWQWLIPTSPFRQC